RAAASAVVTLAALTLAACTDDAPTPPPETVTVTATPDAPGSPVPTPSGTATPSASPLPEPEPEEDEAPFTADRSPDVGEATGDLVAVTDLRFGVHEGYDRIVLDVEGDGTPGWHVEYGDEPRGQASGEPVDVTGDAFLEIVVTPVLMPTEEGIPPYEGPERILPQGAGVVREVRWVSLFEARLQVVVGLASEEPFRAFLLEDPTRLVVDVQHP
ncbi:MAG TPA: hypothetical protein VD838_04775, partial [Anaeromyxobacteraceae bacterium]|nr:hypothetical protein [Anaeromyxobacteraceae bacterium]